MMPVKSDETNGHKFQVADQDEDNESLGRWKVQQGGEKLGEFRTRIVIYLYICKRGCAGSVSVSIMCTKPRWEYQSLEPHVSMY